MTSPLPSPPDAPFSENVSELLDELSVGTLSTQFNTRGEVLEFRRRVRDLLDAEMADQHGDLSQVSLLMSDWLRTAEQRGKIRDKLPGRWSHGPLRALRLVAFAPLKMLELIHRDQREVNSAIIRAIRELAATLGTQRNDHDRVLSSLALELAELRREVALLRDRREPSAPLNPSREAL